ncbi:glycoside hydrolase family 32 protein [Anaerocolumna xylanovorans]|uniref:beta-fructofuranosidase n=1 Tax=Anaerocolumna xylanovorans DSM 12503 TaxID=1121345 RepID=A0A1M7YDH1_9FIRM|nr:glycoside hydrolase family 32 protein [Anaerocolumna xylanovorans]SHO50687.1 Sucrose-6-phosphate hydrolase SacC, GH32 family [Anaerocolumna xylanovorans DSM 12503]
MEYINNQVAALNLRFCDNNDGKEVRLCDSNGKGTFVLCDREGFADSEKAMEENNAFLFDGYSTWFYSESVLPEMEGDFTVEILLAPQGFETGKSGLFCRFHKEKKTGFYVSVKRKGVVVVGFGDGKHYYELESVNIHLRRYQWNCLTVVFNSEAGWCDIFINGKISNRKQFPRHRGLKYSKDGCYIGKYVDYDESGPEAKTGVFHGLMQAIDIYEEVFSSKKVKENYEAKVISKDIIRKELDRSIYRFDAQRPRYHMIAPGKWMNEPHGPMYYKGYYHIFYQANPHAPLWDNIQWGHFISRDMLHWEDERTALDPEDISIAPDGCWSGSSIVDKEDIPVLFFTAGNNGRFPNQGVAVAVPENSKDSRLTDWLVPDDLIVKQTEGMGWLGEFRDPFVWFEEDIYYMLVGTGDACNGGGNALLLSSPDLKDWTNHGFILDYDYSENTEVGHDWELPVLLPLRDKEGIIKSHVLIFCACRIEKEVVEIYYWLGDWDTKAKKFYKHHDKARLIDLGYGTFTGPSGFVTPDKRSILFTLAQGKRHPEEEFKSGWAHNGGIPLELFCQNEELGIRPITEIYSLRGRKLMEAGNVSAADINERIKDISGNMLYAKLVTKDALTGIITEYGQESLEVFYDREKQIFGARDGAGNTVSKYRGDEDRVILGEDTAVFEYFLDHSMLEVYLNQRKSITLRNYSKDGTRRIRLTSQNVHIISFELWEILPVYH